MTGTNYRVISVQLRKNGFEGNQDKTMEKGEDGRVFMLSSLSFHNYLSVCSQHSLVRRSEQTLSTIQKSCEQPFFLKDVWS